jgi:hypothetical protein
MHSFDDTVNPLHTQPGGSRTGGVCPSVRIRLATMDVKSGVQCLHIANVQIESYESDLDMT